MTAEQGRIAAFLIRISHLQQAPEGPYAARDVAMYPPLNPIACGEFGSVSCPYSNELGTLAELVERLLICLRDR